MPVTHEQRRWLRAEMAKAVQAGKSCLDVSVIFDVAVEMVRRGCKENGVTPVHGNTGKHKPKKSIYDWGSVNWSETAGEIARKLGCSRSRACQMKWTRQGKKWRGKKTV